MIKPLMAGIVHLWDLPENIILVGLNENYKSKVLKAIRKSFSRIEDYTNLLGRKLFSFYNFKHNQKITLDFLWKTSKILSKKGFKEFSKEKIEKNITLIGTKRGNIYITNPRLPFNFNSKAGAYFISAILFDGGIDRQFKPHYGNVPFKQRKRIVECVNKIFGTIESKETNPNRGYFVRFPKCMGILLNHCFKIGSGDKMYLNNSIPKFVFNFPEDLKTIFLKQAFDDEGSVKINKKMISIAGSLNVKREDFKNNLSIENYNLLNDLRQILLSLKLYPNPIRIAGRTHLKILYGKKGDYFRHAFAFSITGYENLKRFYEIINFNLEYKKRRLKKLIDGYKSLQLRKGEIHKIALEKAKILQSKFGYFDNVLLTKKINRLYRQTVRITKKLLEDKKIEILEKAIPIGKGWIPEKYKLISKFK